MNKKANLHIDSILWVWRIIITMFVIAFVFLIAFIYLSQDIETVDLENKILLNNLISSESCLATSEKGITKPWLIDLDKVKNERITQCLSLEDTEYKLKIKSLNKTIIKQAKQMSLDFEMAIPVCNSMPDFSCSKLTDNILYKNKEGFLKIGIIELEVVKYVK